MSIQFKRHRLQIELLRFPATPIALKMAVAAGIGFGFLGYNFERLCGGMKGDAF
jgi:uncharacterized protein (DUF2062 family)